MVNINLIDSSVGWGCRIYCRHLCRDVRHSLPTNECPNCANKWLMLNWIVSVTKQYLKPFNCLEIKLLVFDRNTWNYLTVCQQINSVLFKMLLINYSFTNHLDWYNTYLPNPSAWAGYDTRSIFKRDLTGLNSEVSFS